MASAQNVLQLARTQGLTIAVAESCTGGLLGGTLTAPAGASDVFMAGFTTYSNDAKIAMLGVSAATLRAHGAVSEPVAREMADGARAGGKVDLAVSITGVAGPGADGPKPEGRVCFALSKAGADTNVQTIEFGPIGRDQVRAAAVSHALQLLEQALQNA